MAIRVVTISVPKGIRAIIRDVKGPGRPKKKTARKKTRRRRKVGVKRAVRRRRGGSLKKARVLREAARLVRGGKSRSAALKQAWRTT